MPKVFRSIYQLLGGIGTYLLGMGLLGTLLAVRAHAEGFSVVVTGTVMSCYFIGYVAGSFLCPPLIRRVGHIRAFAAMAAVSSAAVIVHSLWVNPWVWGALRMISGINMIGIFMAIESWLTVLVPNRYRGRIFAIYMMVTLLALAGGQYLLLAGPLDGFLPFSLSAMLLSLGLVPIALTRVPQPQPITTPAKPWTDLYRISPLGMAGVFAAGLISGAFWAMGPVFALRVGLDKSGVAMFMSALIVGGAALQWPIGLLSDRFDRGRILVSVTFLGSLLACAAFWSTQGEFWRLAGTAFLCGGAFFSIYSLSVGHLNDHLDSSDVLDATRGLLLLYGLGTAVSPLAASVLMDQLGPGSLFIYFATILAALTAFGLFRLVVAPLVPAEDQGAFMAMVRTSPAILEMQPHSDDHRPNPGAVP